MIVKMKRGATEQDLARVVGEVENLWGDCFVSSHPDYYTLVTVAVAIDEKERQRLRQLPGVQEVYSLMSELPRVQPQSQVA